MPGSVPGQPASLNSGGSADGFAGSMACVRTSVPCRVSLPR
ncbi:MAG TPA: hypothetical protein VM677_09420 [Actinokineospora sp.]|nr:hypothetical protein [Actinokineospora sp.]